jgi:hypothetical protein
LPSKHKALSSKPDTSPLLPQKRKKRLTYAIHGATFYAIAWNGKKPVPVVVTMKRQRWEIGDQ